jgi:hypothetical protein
MSEVGAAASGGGADPRPNCTQFTAGDFSHTASQYSVGNT